MQPEEASQAGGMRSCAFCAGSDPARCTPLDGLLPPGHSRFIAVTAGFVAVPTYGCFVPGYLLVIPRAHVLAFGQLSVATRAKAQGLVDELARRLQEVYGLPALGFEYGLAVRGLRRVEHAHWHLLPSAADLPGWLDERLPGCVAGSFADLPGEESYIAVRGQDGVLRVYDVGQVRETRHRIRVRRAVAALDPRVDDGAWDWAEQRCTDLIRATVADLGTITKACGPHGRRAEP